jgi:hypothetical protein
LKSSTLPAKLINFPFQVGSFPAHFYLQGVGNQVVGGSKPIAVDQGTSKIKKKALVAEMPSRISSRSILPHLIGTTELFKKMVQRPVTRVALDNALDLGLRIGGRGRRMNSKVGIQTNEVKLDVY